MKNVPETSPPWKGYQKIGFRFVLIFFILFIILLDWSANPIFSYLYYYGYLSTGLDIIISWIGKHLFHISYIIVSPYDGEHNDRTYIYLLYFLIALFAFTGTVIWSIADRKRQNYNILYYWFTTIIRYYLAFTMFLFGLYKFFRVQFPDLSYYTLTEQVGNMSPMHLAWAFLGYSHGYNIFMGIAESAGLFLLFRRTTTFGALLTMAALANVIAINFSFDVHAKMYPTALFVMALFLVLRDAERIIRFFFTGQAISLPVTQAPVFSKRWMNISKPILKALVITYFLIIHITDNIEYKNSYQENLKAKSEYSGIYDVETFILDKDTLLTDNPQHWQQLVVGDRTLEAIRFMGDSIAVASVITDKREIIISDNPIYLSTKIQEIYNELGSSDDTYSKMGSLLVAREVVNSFSFELADTTTLLLKGAIKTDSVYVIAKRRDIKINEFRLMKRRFHWVNEASYFY